MARLRVDVDDETYELLREAALAARRPLLWHMSVLLSRAVGLPFPEEDAAQASTDKTPPASTRALTASEAGK